jgi:NAD(P)-dependent dehydrogenase (short-subunit alcohol dehydrogenase family)
MLQMSLTEFPGVALVTGAASGIGRATAKLFAARGCKKIVISDMNPEGLEQVKAAIQKEHEDVTLLAVVTNVRDEASVEDLIAKAVEKFGRIDYCCNVAGITIVANTVETKTEDFTLQYEVLLRGVFFCERAELRAMLKQERLASENSTFPMRGHIVNVASLAGLKAYPDLPAYSAFKHGVIGLTKSDAMKYGPEGIRINAVCPGCVKPRSFLKNSPLPTYAMITNFVCA